MKSKTLYQLVLLCGLAGILFFLIQRNYLVIQITSNPFSSSAFLKGQDAGSNKSIRVYHWKHEKWLSEDVTVIWHQNNIADNVRHVIKQWLLVMQDEHVLASSIMVESVAVTPMGNEAIVSFDHPLFSKDWSVHKKWKILEGLFRTLRFAVPGLQTIHLLVHNHPMTDDHILLEQPLPVQERS